MEIYLTNIGKRFRFEWIFKGIDYHFSTAHRYAILGQNGAGKSTLMKVLSGHLTPSKGTIIFQEDKQSLQIEEVFTKISYAAPYIELIEEFTLTEAITFHQRFKPFQTEIDVEKLITLLGFEKSRDKEIRFFSSGMKQRLKLALAICAQTPILLLDEPTTNLDAQGTAWYKDLLQTYTNNRLVIIATNVVEDYSFFCDSVIKISDYK
jgi:ABC-type multidrug transport system ATPase subunit